jgi:predicted kinase
MHTADPLLTSANFADFAAFDCVILRGLPGSGKSTLAASLAAECGYLHLEADQHFLVNGEYHFDPSRVADAHAVVARDALEALQKGRRVAIANTHVRLWEMAAVVGAARLANRSLCVVECTGTWPNIHGVPDEAIARMKARWEPLPAEFSVVSFRFPA